MSHKTAVPALRRHAALAVFFFASVSCGYSAPAAPPAAKTVCEWTLKDYFHYPWRNELVTYPVDAKTAGNNKLSLAGPNGSCAFQWMKDGTQTRIAFMADVPVDGSATYKLGTGKQQTATDLKIEEGQDEIRLSNSNTGIAIRTALENGQGPVAGMRLASGKWVGDSTFTTGLTLQSYEARVVERGPVLAEVLCTAKFTGGQNWRMRFRLEAGEPVVVANESSTLGAGSSWRLQLNKGFETTKILRRNPLERFVFTAPILEKNGDIGHLEPWLHWNEPDANTWFSFYNDQENDLLSIGVMNPALWVDLDKYAAKIPQAPPQLPVVYNDGAIETVFDLTGGMRRWMISALDKKPSLDLLGPTGRADEKSPEPHAYVIKYSDFPLDRVKDYLLEWPEKDAHPHMIVTPEDVARFRKTYQAPASLQRYLANIDRYAIPDALPVYLGTGDEKVGRAVANSVMALLQEELDQLMKQEVKGSLGSWPHKQSALQTVFNYLDGIWPILTPEERTRARAQAALIAYTVDSPDYWSVVRGFRATANMTTMVAGYRAGAGYLLSDHPLSEKWIEDGMAEAKQQIQNWADENGGWLEAPHYAMTSYDHLIGMFLMSRVKDNGALLYDPKMKKVAEFFARISTPPDAGIGGLRHAPRIGNTWLDEPSGMYGILAGLWKDKDPEFASEMQWMYKQQGSWPDNGIGGAFPSLYGYRPVLLDPNVPEKKPDYGSMLFPRTGVSLRNGMDDRETQLYMIAGTNHEHYDNDSGSITLWGKGRIIANDFAYAEAATQYHSMIDGGGREGLLTVNKFRTTQPFDYVRGISNQWHRQIAFVKDKDFLAPNYFVIRDSMATPSASIWRLWLDGEIAIGPSEPAIAGLSQQVVTLTGKQDVDTDIVLIAKDKLSLTTEAKTSKVFGLGPVKSMGGTQEFGLTAITTPLAAGQDLLTVVYPRLKTQKPPRVTVLAEGRTVKIEHEAGTDYVMLYQTPFTFNEGDIHFEGTAGLVKVRDGKAVVELGEGGKLTALGVAAGN